MSPRTAARQMYAAFAEVGLGQWPEFAAFGDAQQRQIELNPQGLIRNY